MEAIKDILPKMKMTENMITSSTHLTIYKCDKCKDKGHVFWEDADGNQFAKRCECLKKKDITERVERAGLTNTLKAKTFDSFIARNETQKNIKATCIRNVNAKESILLSGQVGSGKTHLAFAMMGELIRHGIYVKYANYADLTRQLSQSAMDVETYYRIMGNLQGVEVLMLDDLFKGNISEANLKQTYELIDYRYRQGKKTIFTTEKTVPQLMNIDEAIGSRIAEMAKGYMISMNGLKNHRI